MQDQPARVPPSGWSAVCAFGALAVVLSWAWWLPLAADGAVVRRGDGSPTHVPGLLGPLIAAAICALVFDRDGRSDWWRALTRLPSGRQIWARAMLPAIALPLGIILLAAGDRLPGGAAFIEFSGASGSLGLVALLVGAVGEEAGWRGYLLPRLTSLLGPRRATIALGALWAVWHIPLFFVLESYRGFGVVTLAGFTIGLASGAIVLSDLAFRARFSVPVASAWHAAYNLSAATTAADGTIAALATTIVIAAAVRILLTDGLRAVSVEVS